MNRLKRLFGQHRAYAAAVATSYGQLAVSMGVQLLMVPLYLQYLGDYRFGALMMLLSFVNFAAFGVVWLSGAMQRAFGEAFARKDEQEFRSVYAVAKWMFVGYAVVLAIVVGGGLVVLVDTVFETPPEHRDSVVGGIVGGAVHFVLMYLLSIDRVALTARGRQASANVLTMVSQVGFALLGVPVLMLGGDLLHLMLCFAAGTVTAIVLGRLHLRKLSLSLTARVRPRPFHRDIAGRLMGRTGGAYLIYGTVMLVLQADVLIVGWIGGPETVAQFVLVWRLAELGVMALWRFTDAQIPFIIHRDACGETAELIRSLRRSMVLMWGGSALAGASYAALGPWVVSLWVGAEKAPTEHLPYILAGGAVMWLGAGRVAMSFVYATARLRALNIVLVLELAAKVLLIYVLLPSFGMLAPLIAINVCYAGGLAVVYPLIAFRVIRSRHGREIEAAA
ncbi:lipopolysaccharide biosynthesis protein [Caenispirillum salinarum]|uniref:lipopolysaccharide biosynthesis protein n=1 Tax=Caenispirillum salinarum TaxID=859058 RepID=UPI00384C4EFE